MMMFFKNQFQYHLKHSMSVSSKELHTPEEVINYVIQTNRQLLDRKEEGWVMITKTKKKGEKEIPICGVELSLPINKENQYFDELLEPFYSTEPISAPELEQSAQVEKNEDQEKTESSGCQDSFLDEPSKQPTEKNKNLERAQQASISPKVEEERGLVSSDEEIHESKDNEDVINEEEPINCYEDASTKPSIEQEEREQPVRLERLNFPYEGYSTALLEAIPSYNPQKERIPDEKLNKKMSWETVIQEVKITLNEQLTFLANEERKHILTTIRQMDHRHLIETEVVERYQSDQKEALNQMLASIQQKKEEQLLEEEKRHKLALESIESYYHERKEEALSDQTIDYESKIQDKVVEEYARQTREITVYCEEQLRALTSTQEERKKQLQALFSEILTGIDQVQHETLQCIEDQKKTNTDPSTAFLFMSKKTTA